jgi:hypothetical protein
MEDHGMSTDHQCDSAISRRRGLALLSLGWLTGCKTETPSGPPASPYGVPLDVTQDNVSVQFDVRIDKPDGYDVVLEIFKAHPKELLSSVDWYRRLNDGQFTEADFSVSIESLQPNSALVVRNEVTVLRTASSFGPSITEKGLSSWESTLSLIFGPTAAEKALLMSSRFYLIERQRLSPGVYRVRCTSRSAMPSLQGRLVKVSIETMHHGK